MRPEQEIRKNREEGKGRKERVAEMPYSGLQANLHLAIACRQKKAGNAINGTDGHLYNKAIIAKKTGIILMVLALILLSTTLTLSETAQQDAQQTQPKLLYLSVEKPYYQMGEKITLIITPFNLQDYELSVSSENNYYKYSGDLQSNIEFYPKEQGTHTVDLVDKQTQAVVDTLMFIIQEPAQQNLPANQEVNQEENQEGSNQETNQTNHSNALAASNKLIWIDKQDYKIGEPVIASVNVIEQDKYKLYYEYNEFTQRYMGEFTEIRFVPRGIGTHYLALTDLSNNEIERASFRVGEELNPPEEQEGNISNTTSNTTNNTTANTTANAPNEAVENISANMTNTPVVPINTSLNITANIEGTTNAATSPAIDKPTPEAIQPTREKQRKGADWTEECRAFNCVKSYFSKRKFYNEAGIWNEINTTIERAGIVDELYDWKAEKNNFKLYAKDNKIRLTGEEGAEIGFEVPSQNAPVVESNVLTYDLSNDYNTNNTDNSSYYFVNATLTLTLHEDRVEKLIVLHNLSLPPGSPGFEYEENLSEELAKGKFTIGDLIIWDSSCPNENEGNESGSCTRNYYPAEWEYEGSTIKFTISQSWLDTAIFPIIIDPTVYYNYSTTATNKAYKYGGATTLAGADPTWAEGWRTSGTSEATSAEYTNMSTNGGGLANILASSGSDDPFWRFEFTVSENRSLINWVYVRFRGYEDGAGGSAESGYCYLANWSSSLWESVQTMPTSNDYLTWNSTSASSAVNTSGKVALFCYGNAFDNADGDEVWVDYVEVIISYTEPNIPPNVTALNYPGNGATLSPGLIQFNFTPTDNTGFTNCTLYTNITGSWAPNKTRTSISNNTINNITVNMPAGNIIWNIRCWDNATTPLDSWYSSNYTLYIVNNPPNVTALNNPGNKTNVTASSLIQFNFTASDDTGFTNCTLYTNATGSWQPNASRTSISNNTVNNITVSMPDGNILWNIICWDNAATPLSDWYTYNYTVHVDTTGPVTTINQPANSTSITTSAYTLNATATDITGISTVTFLYRANSTATWTVACTNNTPVGTAYICTWNLSALSDGNTYEIRAYANDTYGHTSSNDTRYNITVDRNGPSVTLDKPENSGTVTGTSYVVNATATDTGSGVSSALFEYRENSSTSWKTICTDTTPDGTTYSCDWDLTGLSEQNTYEVRATANDTLGNSNSDTHTNIIVARAPDITGASANPQYAGLGQLVTMNASITDSNGIAAALVIITKPNNENVTFTMSNPYGSTYEYTYNPPMAGTYKYTIVANDTQGNQNILDPYFYVLVDATVNLLSQNESYLNNQDVNLVAGYVNWSSDQESSTRQIAAQSSRVAVFNASGNSFIPFGEGYFGTYGNYTSTWVNDNTDFLAIGRDNSGGWGGTDTDLQAYINLSYDISSLGITSTQVNTMFFTFNFCHTDDVTAPISCATAMDGTGNNPANFEVYNYGASTWSALGTFTQSSSAGEQNQTFTVSSGFSNYLQNNLVHGRFEADIALDAGEDATFAIDYANLTVNYTKLDNDGSSDYNSYTSIDGSNYTQLTGFDVIITSTYYNASGSLQAGNNLPDLQVTAYDGSTYVTVGNCSFDTLIGNTSTSPINCTIAVTNPTIISTWKNNTASRRIQVRGINFDEENSLADAINYTDVYIKYFSGSLIANHINLSLSGYLTMTVEKNNSGTYSHVSTVINDTSSETIRNITANNILDIGSLWNSVPFNTNSYQPGYYRISAYLTDENGTILNNSDGSQIIGYETFTLDYLRINITSPQNNSEQDTEGFDANITLSYLSYGSGGMCYYSIDSGPNITMQNITTTFFHNITGIISLGRHNITFYCNDTRGYWFSSSTHNFSAADLTGPTVNLMSPANNSVEPDGNVTFYYNVSDSTSGIKNCTLILDYTTRLNTSYNVSENTAINFTITGLSYENHVWQIECYDNSSNNNLGSSPVYKFLVGSDTTPPEISLEAPEPDYSTTTPTIPFSYTVVDTQSDIANCSLIINGTRNQTNSTILTGESAVNYFSQTFNVGSYNWSINCTDTRGNTGHSDSRIFNVLNDTDYPIITLISPDNSYVDTDGDIIFSYSVTDPSSGITNCSLIINRAINQTSASVAEGTTQYFYLYDLPEGTNINWSINCTDSSANHNKNSSETRNLSVTLVSEMRIRVTSDKSEYQTGELADINTTVKDTLNNNLAASVITDIIRGNATIGWWNTSWQRRKPIILSSSSTLTNALVEVNITDLAGNISSCANEIRIVKNDSNNELVSTSRSIVGGDNQNYCIVRFRANITAGTNNTQFYAYYNNSAAASPGDDETRQNRTVQKLADSGSIISAAAGYDVSSGSYSDTTSDNGAYYAVGRENAGGWTPTNDDLGAYLNLTFNTSGSDIEEANVLFFNMTINFCHTNDVTAPITCGGGAAGTANNPANAEIYNFGTSAWDTFDSFNQVAGSSTEQNLNFSYASSISSYIHDSTGKIWLRYEVDFSLGDDEDASFALDYAFLNITYREKVYSNVSSTGSAQTWVARQQQQTISGGLVSFDFNTSAYSAGAHSAVSKANLSGYRTNYNYTFFNVILDVYGPAITLISPPNNNYSMVRNITFIYTANDVGNGIANCSLIINNAINQTNYTVVEGASYQYFYTYEMPDGNYNWSINCTDTLGNINASQTRNLTIGGDVYAPVVTLYNPYNNTPFLTGSTVVFNYSATDSLSDLANCSLILNSTLFNTTSNPAKGAMLNFTATLLGDGNYTWSINCTDNSSNKNIGSSETRYFSIGPDNTGPVVNLKTPSNGGQADNGNVTFTYNVSDFLSGISNCTLRLYNSSFALLLNSTNSSVQEITNQYVYAYNLADGLHYWNVSCWDNASIPNQGFSSTYNFTIASDTTAPVVHLLSPPDYYQDVDGNVTFYFNVSEDITTIANCSLIFNGTVNTTKNGSEITNNAVNNFTLYNMGTANYLWKVNCSDTAALGSNIGTSAEQWTLIVAPDTAGPTITLFNPPNGIQDTDGTVTFEFNASDYASNITNCSLVFNNTVNYTWSSINESQHYSHTIISIPNGNYTWYVNCTDNSISYNKGKSETRNISIGADVTAPSISLIAPEDDTTDTDGDITFIYNVTDYSSNVTECSLIIGGSVNQTETDITEGEYMYFYLYDLEDTQFSWSIECTDDAPTTNTGSSETRDLTVKHPYHLITDITTDNTSYVQGQVVKTTSNVTNISGALMNSSIVVDIVRGNGKGPWWNSNWNYRIPLDLDAGTTDKEYALAEKVLDFTDVLTNQLNITGESLDINSIRVVEWEPDNDSVEVPSIFTPSSGFDALSNAVGTVRWVMDGSVPAGTLRQYYIYFDITDNAKTAPSYAEPNYTFTGSGKSINYDGSSISRDYLTLSSGDESFSVQFSDGDSLANQQHIQVQGAGAIWNLSIGGDTITNKNSSLVPVSVAASDSFTTSSTSNVSSGPITRIVIPGDISTVGSSTAQLEYLVWFSSSEVFIKANFTATFGSGENNNYAFENTWFSYLFDDDNNTGWTNFINKMESQTRSQTHDYHGVQENTYNTFNAGDWYMEYAAGLGAIGMVADIFTVNSADATKGVVTFDDDNDGSETDMVGFSNNGNPDITAGDTYNLVVWIILTPQASSTARVLEFRDQVLDDMSISQGQGEEFIERSSGSVINGFYYYNFSTGGQRTGNYSAIARAYKNEYVNASAYTWFNITPDTIPPTVTLVRPQGWINYDDINFTFYIAEGGSGIYNCSLYINGAYNYSKNSSQITDYANNTFNISNIPEGNYNWTVICYDNNYNNGSDDAFNLTIDITLPIVNITLPGNNGTTKDPTPLFNFTITDNLADPINYTIFVNGIPNGQNGTAANNTPVLLNITYLEDGIYNITVRATDYANNSANQTILIRIDVNPPAVHFETQNGTWFNDTTPQILFNISDAVDSSLDFVVYVNGTFDQAGTTPRNTSKSINLSSYGEGRYNITIRPYDDANNSANYSIIIYIDLTKPNIILNYPNNSANFTTSSISLNFTATDNLDMWLRCNLTLDGIINRTNFEANDSQETTTLVQGLREGAHYWNVTCWDNATNTNTSETRSFNIFTPPRVNLTFPPNGNVTRNRNQTFYFNVSDDTGIYNCSLIFNGAINTTKTGSQIINNATNNFTVNYMNGTYNWSVRCFDNSTLYMQGDSENWTITVDIDAPYPVINTLNNSWFNTSTPLINFTITDNFDQLINYTFYANSSTNAIGAASNNVSTTTNLLSLGGNSSYEIKLQAYDNAGNYRNSTSIIIYIDTVRPNIILNAPTPGYEFNNTVVLFNFTASDNMANYTMCNLSISNGMYEYNINASSGVPENITKTGFVSGTYYWNVSCVDFAGNRNTSETWNFTVLAPDLLINSGNITFNETYPEEGRNITIYANIYNLGGSPATNVTVQFWRGDPDSGGVQINSNLTIATLTNGQNFTFNVTYTTIMGDNIIYVVVDPPTATNGTITEENESNNKANRTIMIELYQVYAGNTTALIDMEKQSINRSLYQWEVANVTGSNIFVADIEASPNFNALQAIGRDTSNNSAANDFTDIDTELGTIAYPDSINMTFTSGGSPVATRSFIIFSRTINNVPVINSTNTSNFVTGILWDTSDGNTQYNGTQDLLFNTEINQNKQGSQGIYDFEIKVPALLRNYNAAGTSVAFYVELK